MKSIERPTTLTTLVAERLRADILSGQLGPGEHLRQNEVASTYGVSSTPVREAFAVLERDGLVIVQPHRGVTIVEPTIEDIHEIYEIRKELECLAIELACANDEPDLEPIRTAMEGMIAGDPADPAAFALNRTFHEEIYALANRPRLVRMIADLRDASTIYMTLLVHYVEDRGALETADDDHQEIFAALEKRNAKSAVAALGDHLDKTVQSIEKIFEDRKANEQAAS